MAEAKEEIGQELYTVVQYCGELGTHVGTQEEVTAEESLVCQGTTDTKRYATLLVSLGESSGLANELEQEEDTLQQFVVDEAETILSTLLPEEASFATEVEGRAASQPQDELGEQHAVQLAPILPEATASVGSIGIPGLRLDPNTFMQNAALQLQSVAQHVALQNKVNAATRLMQQKQLESLRIQMQPVQVKENTEVPMPTPGAVYSQTVELNQLPNNTLNTSGIRLSPQVRQMQPLNGSGVHQFLLQNSPMNSPIQLFVHRSVPFAGSASFTNVSDPTLNVKETNVLHSLSAAAAPSVTEDCFKKQQKIKKTLKVKTRSGRISRPPKHKAKDYKFIKNEDLVNGRLSDSDDYSELSLEDGGEEEVEKEAFYESSNYYLKPKIFKCHTCEKSYIGKGGLARHYKLNPKHESINYYQQNVVPMSNGNGDEFFVDYIGKEYEINKSVPPEDSVLASLSVPPPPHVEEMELEYLSDQQSVQSIDADRLSESLEQDEIKILWSPTLGKGPGRPKGCRKPERPRKAGRPRCSRRHGRSGRSSKTFCEITAEKQILRRKNRLKELLQQCANEDLMELALPCLIPLVTVWEFMLMKMNVKEEWDKKIVDEAEGEELEVENSHPAKLFFPAVYREFEKLHEMVQSLAQDHFSNTLFLTIQQTLEIKNPKVAESLGITKMLLEKQNHILSPREGSLLRRVDEQFTMEKNQQNCVQKNANQELFPPSKKIKAENVLEDKPNTHIDANGIKQQTLNWCVESTKDSSIWQHADCAITDTNCRIRDGSEVKKQNSASTVSHGKQCKDLSILEAIKDSSNSSLFVSSKGDTLDCSKSTSWSSKCDDVANKLELPAPTESRNVQVDCETGNSLESSSENRNIQCKLLNSESSNSILSMNEVCSQHIHLSNKESREPINEDLQCNTVYLGTLHMHDHSEQVYASEQMQELDNMFSVNLPIDHVTMHMKILESETALAPKLQNVNALPCSTEEPSMLSIYESAITENGTVSYEFANESHALFTQEHEQIFIQTSDGLILSHPSSAGLSPTEGIFIVTNVDGTTMQIRTSGGVPLETVEALMAMEAQGQSEGILISQSETDL